jgi:hypothetical protein
MKGTVYENRLPRDTLVKTGWEPLSEGDFCRRPLVETLNMEIVGSFEALAPTYRASHHTPTGQ